MNKLKTIDDCCNQPKGSFKKFIKKKEKMIKSKKFPLNMTINEQLAILS